MRDCTQPTSLVFSWLPTGEFIAVDESSGVNLQAITYTHKGKQYVSVLSGLGADTYVRHCSACHGVGMKNPEGAFDLMRFSPDQAGRFQNLAAKGKNSMPPWDGLLKAKK